MRSNVELLVGMDADDLATSATRVFLRMLKESKGDFTIALSGGSTPRRFHQRLVALDREDMPWGRIVVTFSDERAVAPDHPDSNYRMARETLLDAAPIGLSRIHRIPAEDADLDKVALDYEATIRTFGDGAIDLVILGMGGDGHTASLFPSHPTPPAGRLVWATPISPTSPLVRRVTFTYEAIAKAKRVMVLVSGGEKSARLLEVLDSEGELPLQKALAARKGPTFVITDGAAAKAVLAKRRSES
jgi:6-phosphogluconolactonase